MLRIAILVVAAVIGVSSTALASGQHLPVKSAAHISAKVLTAYRWALPNEPGGRVTRWENDRLVAAEAEKQKAQARAPAAPPAIPSYPPGTVQDIITRIFTPLGGTAVAWGLRVARCESGYNPRSGYPNGPYYGLFQFALGTFRATPYGSQDVFDPTVNASAAAWKYSKGGAGAWGCK